MRLYAAASDLAVSNYRGTQTRRHQFLLTTPLVQQPSDAIDTHEDPSRVTPVQWCVRVSGGIGHVFGSVGRGGPSIGVGVGPL